MSFRRHLKSTVRSANRNNYLQMRRMVSDLDLPKDDIKRDMTLAKMDEWRWSILSDTAGTPAPAAGVAQSWSEGPDARILDDARGFLTREADLVVEIDPDSPAGSQTSAGLFAKTALYQLSIIHPGGDIHDEIAAAAQRTVDTLSETPHFREADGRTSVAPADAAEIPMREICGLDGNTAMRGPEAGDAEAAARICRRFRQALRAEAGMDLEHEDETPSP